MSHFTARGSSRLWRTVVPLRLLALVLALLLSLNAMASPALDGPHDSPRLSARSLNLPEPPKGYAVHDAEWIRFAYSPTILEKVRPLINEAEQVREELRARLGQSVLQNVHVYVARTAGEMATLAPAGAPFPKYASGVAYSQLGLVLLTVNSLHPGDHHDLLQVFRHELSHIALSDAVGGRPLPRWFNEGFAVFASGESSLVRLKTLWTATLADRLLSLKDMERRFPSDAVDVSVAYAQAADIVRFLVRQQERHRFRALILHYRKKGDFDAALTEAYATDLFNLEHEWREDVAKRYTFWPVLFSGTFVWVGAFGLFVWGYRRRTRRNKETLARWAEEEAREDARQLSLSVPDGSGRLHIVLSRSAQPQPQELPAPVPVQPVEIPKVEHDGSWHTLH